MWPRPYRIDHGVFDVRGHMDWLEDDLASKTVEDRVAMLHRKLGPNFRRETQGATDRVVRLEDNAGEGKADKSTIFADGFNHSDEGIGSGVLARKGNVYFTDIPNLWLLRDTTGNGTADFRKSLSYGYGVCTTAFTATTCTACASAPMGNSISASAIAPPT